MRIMLLVALIAVPCFGQISSDEARRHLAERASTRPAATQTSEAAQLRSIIAGLQIQIGKLRAENQELRKQIITAKNAPAPANVAAAADQPHKLSSLMTTMSEAQVRALLGTPETESASGDGLKVCVWREYAWEAPEETVRQNRVLHASDPLGEIPGQGEVKVKNLKREIKVWFKDGAIDHFTDSKNNKVPEP